MKRMQFFAGLLVVAGFCVLPARGQDAAKKKLGPAPSPSQAVLEQWNDIGRKLIAMAGDFPEDKFGFKPQAESRTFLANMLHAGASMYYFTDTAMGKKPPPWIVPRVGTLMVSTPRKDALGWLR